MPIETIVAPVDKSNPALDLQIDFIFGGNGGKCHKYRIVSIDSIDFKMTLSLNFQCNTTKIVRVVRSVPLPF